MASENQVVPPTLEVGAPAKDVSDLAIPCTGSFSDKLAAALGIPPVPRPGPIQQKFNEYRRHLRNRVIATPLPENVHLLDENFLYWIKLNYPNVAMPGKWIGAKASVVIPLLDAGTFDETGFKMDDSRLFALPNIPALLQSPNCIHKNLRHQAWGDRGGIRGEHVYVAYYGKKKRKVAFTLFDPRLGKVILVSSFWSHKAWVEGCTEMPAIFVKAGCQCRCK
jgi:hypothetical protein